LLSDPEIIAITCLSDCLSSTLLTYDLQKDKAGLECYRNKHPRWSTKVGNSNENVRVITYTIRTAQLSMLYAT